MRLLLPPSEAKTPGGRGAPLTADRFGAEPLAGIRRRLVGIVEAVAAADPVTAATAFDLPPAVATAALAANAHVLTAPTRPALDRYAGTVYEGLAVPAMTPGERRTALRVLLVFSGLFGVLGAGEPVPDYRVPAASVLPGVGRLATFWRPHLDAAMPAVLGTRGLVVDLRSSDYAAMWRPRPALARRVVVVRMLSTKPDGTLGIISYTSKLAKGRLAAALIQHVANGGRVRTVDDVAAVWLDAWGGTAVIVDGPGPVRLELLTG